MKNQVLKISRLVFFLLLSALLVFVLPTCKDQDSLFEQYIVPGGHYYPGRALDPQAFSGRYSIQIEWQNGSDPTVTKARIFWNNDTNSVEVPISAGMKTVSKIIEDLEEKEYTFRIRTYDNEGNVSIPVETFGVVYGEMYESQLLNRSASSAIFHEPSGSMRLEWLAAEETVVDIQLEYTNTQNVLVTLPVEPSETNTTIPDFKPGGTLFITTSHKPESAISVFQAAKTNIQYTVVEGEWVEITDDAGLVNTGPSFARGNVVVMPGSTNRFYLVQGWDANAAAAVNGNVDNQSSNFLLFFTYHTMSGVNVVPYTNELSIENAKLSQTIELEPGKYKLEAEHYVFNPTDYGPNTTVYMAVTLEDELPNIEVLTQGIPSGTWAIPLPTKEPFPVNRTYHWFTVEFEVTQKGNVTLGFVANADGLTQYYFREIKLFGLQ